MPQDHEKSANFKTDVPERGDFNPSKAHSATQVPAGRTFQTQSPLVTSLYTSTNIFTQMISNNEAFLGVNQGRDPTPGFLRNHGRCLPPFEKDHSEKVTLYRSLPYC